MLRRRVSQFLHRLTQYRREVTSATATSRDAERPPGPAGNERLTAWLGATLFVLLAVEGVTIVGLGLLTVPHIVVGMVIVGPVAFKIASTTYRFGRYYTGDRAYRRAGPPAPVPRVLGPLTLVLSVAVLATGAALLFVAPSDRNAVYGWHKASFIAWFVVMTGHVLWYAWRVPGLLAADVSRTGRAETPPGRAWRFAALAAALLVGAVLAAATYHLAAPWQGGPFLGG
jgi:hypothetical protein